MSASRSLGGIRLLQGFLAVVMMAAVLFGLPASAEAVVVVSSIAEGYDQACAVDASGAGYCWGRNNLGQLGDGTATDSSIPVTVSGSHTWSKIVAADQSTCGLTTAGVAYCWGWNNHGQLGDNTHSNSSIPVAVAGGYTWTDMSVGDEFACGIRNTGAAYCWGFGTSGQMGDGSGAGSDTPTLVSGGYTWTAISAGKDSSQHACGVTNSGAGYCWGANGSGQLGVNSTTPSLSPALVNGSYTWSSLSAGGATTCGVTTAGAGYCWGSNYIGQMGDNTTFEKWVPTAISGGRVWGSINIAGAVSCGLTTAGAGYCWGANGLGALGDGTNTNSSVPVVVAGGYTFARLAVGSAGACAITQAGSMMLCWGWNAYGTLGDGTTTNRNSPAGVVNLSIVVSNAIVSVAVVPSFSFVVAGFNSGSCNGATINATSSTATAVPLRPTIGTNAIGGQTLTVNTNAGNGYTIFVRSTGALSDGVGHTIADWSGTNGAPTTFASPGTAAMGYTTDHVLSGSATRFQTDKWAGYTGTNTEVATAASGVTSDVTHVCVQAGIAATTAAGTYQTTVVYTAVPTY